MPSIGRLTKAALLASTAAGVARVARAAAGRHRAMDAVSAELRHPALYLPLHLNAVALRLLPTKAQRPTPIAADVTAERRITDGREHFPDVPVWVYQPAQRTRPAGALLWIHGGGFVMGSPVTYHETCSRFAAELGIVVVSVDYRLAPANPFPAPLEDCYTALAWLHAHADELGIAPRRVAIGGDSAGGGLTACLAQLAHDRDELPVAFQLLLYPMLDDRTVLRADHAGTGTFIWSPKSNRFGWSAYLGHAPVRRRRPSTPQPPAAKT